MSWVRLDDDFADHPKMVIAGPLSQLLHVKAMLYCGRYLTDGKIPKAVVPSLVDWATEGVFIRVAEGDFSDAFDVPRNFELADRLVEVGAWVKADDGYIIHDYLEYQPSRAAVLAERQAAKDRVAKARAARNGSGDVRANNGRSSHCPIPIPSPKTEQKKPEETTPIAAEPRDEFDFEALYALYPKKVGKKRGLRTCSAQIKAEQDFLRLRTAIENYARLNSTTEWKYLKQFDSFMGVWEDFVDPQPARPARPRGITEPMAHVAETKIVEDF